MYKVDIIEYQNLSEPVRVTVVTGLLNIPDTGVPKGGKKGQNLTKKSDSDFDTYWADHDDINSIEHITLNGEDVPVEDKTANIKVDAKTLGFESTNVAYTDKENTFTERQKFEIPYNPEDDTWYNGYIDASAVKVSKIKYDGGIDTGRSTHNDAILTSESLKLTRRINTQNGSDQRRIQLDLDGIKRAEYVNHVLANYGYIFPKTYPNQNVTLATIEDLTAQFGSLNIQNGSGIKSIQQVKNTDGTTIPIKTKNPNAVDQGAPEEVEIGATGESATVFGGAAAATAKRAFAAGTNTAALGKYSATFGDNCVSIGNDSFSANYQNTAKGQASAVFGSGNISAGKGSFVAGALSIHSGEYGVSLGKNNNGTFNNSVLIGNNLTDSAAGQIVFGDGAAKPNIEALISVVTASKDEVAYIKRDTGDVHLQQSLTVRYGISSLSAESVNNFVKSSLNVGENNTTPEYYGNGNPQGSGVIGQGNIVAGKNSLVAGNTNITRLNHQFAFGISLDTGSTNTCPSTTVVGFYNKHESGDVFQVGAGTGTNRRNAFRVLADGRAKVQTTPKDNDDVVRILELDTKYDKAGGTIGGDVIITGDLTVNGTQHINNTENLNVENAMIYSNATGATLATNGGIGIKKNATDVYGIVYDPTSDSVKLGLGKSDANGVFTFNASEGQPVAIRDDSSKFNANHFIKWNEEQKKLVDSGYLAEDFVDVATQQSIGGMKTFTDEVHFGTTHFSKDLNVDNAAVKIFDNLKDLVTQYKADSIVIYNGTGSSAVQYILTLPKKTGTLLLDLFKFSQFGTSNDGDNWTLNDSTKNLEIKYQDANSHSGLQIEKDYIELSDINGTGTAKISLASNILSFDSEDKEGNHKLVRVSPDKVSIGNGTDAFLVEIDSLSAKFNNRPQVKDNGNYVNVALVDDLNNYVASQSESADKYYAQITNENGIISARIFKNGEEDIQNLIISKDGVKVLGKSVANTEQVDGKIDKLAASLRNQAYVRNANGEDSGLAYTYTDEGGTLAVRNASGQLQVSDPSQDKDATNKSYADNLNARYVSTSILGG